MPMSNPALRHVAGDFDRLPTIDVSGLYSDQLDDRLKVAAEIGAAARNAGFFYIVGHQVGRELRDQLINYTKAFFSLPLEEKMKSYIGKSNSHRGYVPEGEEVFAGGKRDRKEAFDTGLELPADDPDVLAGLPMLGPNQWPRIPGFSDAVSAYYRAVFELGRTLFRSFALALELPEDYFDRFITKPPTQLRLIHYPYDGDAHDRPGIGAHTDYECFTILLPTAPGLEVMNGAGQWIDAPPIEDGFVINIGDMMEIWTAGQFVATSHRVRKVSEERYSFPLFFACDYRTQVAPLEKFASPEALQKYPPLSAGDHLFAQTAQSFTYLKEKMARGDLVLPEGSRKLASLGQQARYAEF